MKAVIEVDVPEYQIGQEVSVYFKDTMCIKGVCQEDDTIEKFEKIKEEMQGLIDFEKSCCGDATLGYECLDVIEQCIEELKGENK